MSMEESIVMRSMVMLIHKGILAPIKSTAKAKLFVMKL